MARQALGDEGVVLTGARRVGFPTEFERLLLSLGANEVAVALKERRLIAECEAVFQARADGAPVMLWTAGPDKLFDWFNRPWLDFTGRTIDHELGEGWMAGVHPDDYEWCRAVQSEAVLARRAFDTEYRLRRRDGEYRWIVSRGVPRFGVNGSFAGYIGSAIDITERKAAEQEMRTFASLAGQSADFIGLASLDGGTLFVNPGGQVLVGLSDVDARRPTLLDYVVEDDRPAGAEALARTRADGQWTGELRLRHFTTGQSVPTSWNLCLVSNEAAPPASFGLVARDLSAHKQIEEDLRRQDRLKDEFLATLSHELRTPLNAIVGWAHILRATPQESDTMPKGLETILRSAHALNRMVSDILDVSRIIAGKLILNLRPIRLAAVLEAALDTMQPVAQAKNVALVGDLDVTAGGNFSGDPDRLQQVACNLLTNAIKFTPPVGSVRLFLRAAGDRVEFGVEDDGPGISPGFLPHIFERFRQADSSATRRHDGLGLGLAIVQHLAELHGGTATAANRQGQQGAVFTVRLPHEGVRDERPMAVAPHPVEHGATWRHDAPSLHGLTVVVVDDEADARELVAMVLESCGARTIAVPSAAEGLQAVMREHPDVLLADIAMPGEDGYALMRKVRALPPEQGGMTPAAALTAFASQDERLNVLRGGFQAHLAKPANPAELIATVAGLTRGATAAAASAAERMH